MRPRSNPWLKLLVRYKWGTATIAAVLLWDVVLFAKIVALV
jgi:hypothetical protein